MTKNKKMASFLYFNVFFYHTHFLFLSVFLLVASVASSSTVPVPSLVSQASDTGMQQGIFLPLLPLLRSEIFFENLYFAILSPSTDDLIDWNELLVQLPTLSFEQPLPLD
jgi:hypothetical protein